MRKKQYSIERYLDKKNQKHLYVKWLGSMNYEKINTRKADHLVKDEDIALDVEEGKQTRWGKTFKIFWYHEVCSDQGL